MTGTELLGTRLSSANVFDEIRNELRTSYARVTQRVTRRVSRELSLQTPKVMDLEPFLSIKKEFLFYKEREPSQTD